MRVNSRPHVRRVSPSLCRRVSPALGVQSAAGAVCKSHSKCEIG